MKLNKLGRDARDTRDRRGASVTSVTGVTRQPLKTKPLKALAYTPLKTCGCSQYQCERVRRLSLRRPEPVKHPAVGRWHCDEDVAAGDRPRTGVCNPRAPCQRR